MFPVTQVPKGILKLDLKLKYTKSHTKVQLNISKHVGKKCGNWRTYGESEARRVGRTDIPYHDTIGIVINV